MLALAHALLAASAAFSTVKPECYCLEDPNAPFIPLLYTGVERDDRPPLGYRLPDTCVRIRLPHRFKREHVRTRLSSDTLHP